MGHRFAAFQIEWWRVKVFIWEWSDKHSNWERVIVFASAIKEARQLALAKGPLPRLAKVIAGKPTATHEPPYAIYDIY